jgi:hypothetical protein
MPVLSSLFGGPNADAAAPTPESPVAGWGTAPAGGSFAGPAESIETKPLAEEPKPEVRSPSGSGTVAEGFASLFQTPEKVSPGASAQSLPWNQSGAAPKGPAESPQGDAFGFGPKPTGDPAPGPDANWTGQAAATSDATFGLPAQPHPGVAPSPGLGTPAATVKKPAGSSRRPRTGKETRIFSPLVITVLVLGLIFLGGIFLLKGLGGVEGVKDRIRNLLQQSMSEVEPGAADPMLPPAQTAPAAASPEPATPAVDTPKAPSQEDVPVPATPVEPAPPAPAAETETSQPAPASERIRPEPAPATAVDAPPVAAPASPGATDAIPETPPTTPPTTPSVGASGTPGAPVSTGETTPIPNDQKSPEVPAAAPMNAIVPGATDGAQAAALPAAQPETSPAADAAAPAAESGDVGKKMGTLLETVGTEVIQAYYQSDAIDERVGFVIDPELSQSRMEAYYRRYQTLPTLQSVSFRGPMRDAASGRWFGVFDVREKENEELHRWCVVQIRPGELKLDWVIYQQLIDESLDRFLADPASPPKDFSLVVRRGDEAPSDENPWQGKTYELYLQPPLDTAQPRVVLVRESDFEKLGLKNALIGGNARIGRVELEWTASEIEPMTRVPTISRVLGWGAW